MKTKLLIGLLLLFFTACVPIESIETRLRVLGEERWDADVELILAPESAIFTSELDQMLDSDIASVEDQGVTFSWHQEAFDQEGRIKYALEFSGEGFDLLNSTLLNQNAITVDEATGNIIFSAFSDYGQMTGAGESKFILQGGRIISTNGNQVNTSTVEWINPTGHMEAVLTPGSGFNWLLIPAILIVVGGGVAAYWYLFRKPSSSTPASVASTSPASFSSNVRYCPECGSQMRAGAKFCPQCGATQH